MYSKMLQFVKENLEKNGGEIMNLSFRKRSEHIRRVFMWVKRLIEDEMDINKEAILVAAIFHDSGYSRSFDNSEHAEYGANICEKYLKENGYDTEFIQLVVYLVRNHSNKELMTLKETPKELLYLMEGDLLDEAGALSILWDSMKMGYLKAESYEDAWNQILDYSYKQMKTNPMVSKKAKEIWIKKQNLLNEFLKQLAYDLDVSEI